MIYLIEFKEEARKDIIEATEWYRKQQTGLDKKFLDGVEETIKRIVSHPTAGRRFYNFYRETSLKKFPYVIVYEIIFDAIVIYQVFHTRQNPRKKIRRLKK